MPITGKWKIEDAELGGKKLPAAAFANFVLELDETSYQLWEKEVIDSGLLELIDDSDPKALLITGVFGPYAGKIFGCIYKFEGKRQYADVLQSRQRNLARCVRNKRKHVVISRALQTCINYFLFNIRQSEG